MRQWPNKSLGGQSDRAPNTFKDDAGVAEQEVIGRHQQHEHADLGRHVQRLRAGEQERCEREGDQDHEQRPDGWERFQRAGSAAASVCGDCRLTQSGSRLCLYAEKGNDMAAQMFAAIRRGKIKPGMADEFAKRVKAGALPVMKKMDGFKAYYLVMGPDDTATAVSLYTNKTVAEGSTQKLMPWIKENLGPLLAGPPEAFDGEVVISDVT